MVDHFRNFPRPVVVDCMMKTKIEAAPLSGASRKADKGNVLDFETYYTISDPVEYFAEAMNTELEHGRVGEEEGTNVTSDDPLATARIASAHLKGVEHSSTPSPSFMPFLQYYDWLWWVEELHSRAIKRV